MNRAYSLLEIKSVDAERRVIRGIATTPTPDRGGHSIDPLGVTFTNPLPLLWHHDQQQPVGTVLFDPPTAAGITFTASLPIITEPGRVKDRVDEAWHSLTAEPPLVRGTSIGWKALDPPTRLPSGVTRFGKTLVAELSLVTVPMNVEATILSLKQCDLAASGPHSPGVTGLPVVYALKGAIPMTTTEQITQFENTRAAKVAAMNELQNKAVAEGRSKDPAEKETFDGLNLEIKSIDAELVDLRDMEKINVAAATKITPTTASLTAADLRGGKSSVIQVKSMLPPGTAFTRYAMAIAAARGSKFEAIEYAKRWEDSTPEVVLALKAAIAPGTTTDATWAGPLAALRPATDQFIELLRPATVLGKIPNLRQVPFMTSVPTQTAGGTYGWVGQGAAKPVTNLQFGTTSLGMAKAAGIIVLTEELVRVSSPSAEAAVRNDMIKGIAQFLDTQFLLPAVAEVVNVSPASITNGTTPLTSAGTTSANARTDILALIGTVLTANGDMSNLVLVMSQSNAMALGAALNPLGQALFPGLGASGGTILGIPVVTSQAAGANIILLDSQGILFADDGAVTIDVSREASLQMDSAPDSPADGDTVLVSLWQMNLVGLRAERFINWKRASLASVKYVVQTYA